MSYTCKTLLSSGNPSASASDLCIIDVMNQWIQFVWKDGGGLPLPFPPIILSSSTTFSVEGKPRTMRDLIGRI